MEHEELFIVKNRTDDTPIVVESDNDGNIYIVIEGL